MSDPNLPEGVTQRDIDRSCEPNLLTTEEEKQDNALNGTLVPLPDMTLRDWFAGQALISAVELTINHKTLAEECYKIADAMIKESGKS